MSRVFGAALLVVTLLSSCIGGGGSSTKSSTQSVDVETLEVVKYAKGYEVKRAGDLYLLEITDPTGESKVRYKYALVPRGKEAVEIPDGYSKIETPLRGVICMTTLQLSGFIKLGLTDRIVGITSTRFLKNRSMNERLQSGKLSKIGIEGEFDTEVVLSLNPDLIMVSPFKRGGYDAVENLGIPMLAYLGYKETTPLGQAEWIKLVGLLLGVEEQATKEFERIESRYLELTRMTEGVENRPRVLSGELHSGNWYIVGGDSYMAQLFRDAGGDYFMKNDNKSGGFYVDYETVYSQGHDADYWRVLNNHNGEYGYSDLLASDGRYADFKAFQKRQVLYCNLRDKPYYENTPMEPEVVLADLIKVFHPTLLPDYEAEYYKLLTK